LLAMRGARRQRSFRPLRRGSNSRGVGLQVWVEEDHLARGRVEAALCLVNSTCKRLLRLGRMSDLRRRLRLPMRFESVPKIQRELLLLRFR